MLDGQAGSLGQQPALLDGGQARAILAVVGEVVLQRCRLRCRHGRQRGGGSVDAAAHGVRHACASGGFEIEGECLVSPVDRRGAIYRVTSLMGN